MIIRPTAMNNFLCFQVRIVYPNGIFLQRRYYDVGILIIL